MRLVDDLLDVSRITANKIHLRREAHELTRLMATAVESIMPLETSSRSRDGDRRRIAERHVKLASTVTSPNRSRRQYWKISSRRSHVRQTRARTQVSFRHNTEQPAQRT